ncbi:hypothetical protein ACFY2H_38910 [Streptomyces griseofuscus]|uniref:hypothetical protein n=1 Tax=Streptomyces griseofuscus TaxID=146922 RepID=UPI0036CA4AA2
MTGDEIRSTLHFFPSAVVTRRSGESVVDEDGGDGGGEGIGVKGSLDVLWASAGGGEPAPLGPVRPIM